MDQIETIDVHGLVELARRNWMAVVAGGTCLVALIVVSVDPRVPPQPHPPTIQELESHAGPRFEATARELGAFLPGEEIQIKKATYHSARANGTQLFDIFLRMRSRAGGEWSDWEALLSRNPERDEWKVEGIFSEDEIWYADASLQRGLREKRRAREALEKARAGRET